MAGRFRFTPLCCCSQQEADVCVPDCTVIADRIVTAAEEMTVDAAVSASRHCPGEDFWHGFYLSGNYAYPLTVETVDVSGTPRARGGANSVIHQISYADGAVKYTFTSSNSTTYALINYAYLLNSTNATQADVESYFVYDSFDQRVHYNPSVTEPAWVRIFGLPYDYSYCPFRFTYDGTEAGYAAAARQRLVPSGRYKTADECGFPRLTCSSDFTDNATAWAQYHTGTSSAYSIAAENLDAWITSLADGTHHYGAEKFYVLRLSCQRTGWSLSGGKPVPTFPQAAAEVIEYRFNRDAPTFSPMAPAGEYSVSRVYEETNRQSYPGITGYNRHVYGTPAGIPSSWKCNPYETPGEFYGRYHAIAVGVSHRPLSAAGAYNSYLPLGRWTYTPPESMDGDFPRVTSRTSPVFAAKATLEKKVSEWTLEDWVIYSSANFVSAQGGTLFPGNIWNRDAAQPPTLWRAWWRRPTARVYGTTDKTPAAVVQNGHAWAWDSSLLTGVFRDGRTTYQSSASLNIGTSAAAPSADWSLVSETDADFYGVDTSPYNQYAKIEFFNELVLANTSTAGSACWIPKITDAIINEIVPNSFYVLTGIVADQSGKTFYCFPQIYCGMIATTL